MQVKPSLLKECSDANLNGFPTWDFGEGKRVQGDQELDFLQDIVDFKRGLTKQAPEATTGSFSKV